MTCPLTPSDTKEYQDNHPIGPKDEFIVAFACTHMDANSTLKEVFNRYGKGEVAASLSRTFWIKDISWAIVNELRAREDVSACGPASGKKFGPA